MNLDGVMRVYEFTCDSFVCVCVCVCVCVILDNFDLVIMLGSDLKRFKWKIELVPWMFIFVVIMEGLCCQFPVIGMG